MDSNVFKAILSLDAYNRGYNPGIKFGNLLNDSVDASGTKIGNAVIYKSKNDNDAKNIGFYALAYKLSSGETIVSYRGTDTNPLTLEGFKTDVWQGWLAGAGDKDTKQAMMAIEFYQAVAKQLDPKVINYSGANISLTGHSLGGGLAGMVSGENNNSSAFYH